MPYYLVREIDRTTGEDPPTAAACLWDVGAAECGRPPADDLFCASHRDAYDGGVCSWEEYWAQQQHALGLLGRDE
ncbi:hypothetical protein [Streptomonospora litoralis]|nr:hypothetical protein [Streptomonospora litoralis]